MADYKINTQNSVVPTSSDDCYLPPNDPIHELKALAGLGGLGYGNKPNWAAYQGSNVSDTGMEKAQLQREHKIEPGTPEWFKLWFSRPYLTGEKPI